MGCRERTEVYHRRATLQQGHGTGKPWEEQGKDTQILGRAF